MLPNTALLFCTAPQPFSLPVLVIRGFLADPGSRLLNRMPAMQALPHGTSHRASASLPIRGAGAGIAMASGGMNSGMVYLDEGTHRRGQQAMAGQRLSLRGGGDPGAELKVDWTQVGGSLFGGLALFLYGMERMGVGLKNAFGDQLRSVLLALSYNRFHMPPCTTHALKAHQCNWLLPWNLHRCFRRHLSPSLPVVVCCCHVCNTIHIIIIIIIIIITRAS
jgi:hypothetical protein